MCLSGVFASNKKYGDEATSYANEAVKDSQCLKRISEAAFDRQDMNEIAALAKQLREEILQVLHVFTCSICAFMCPKNA